MTRKARSFRPSPALVISCLALFMAFTGSALAVSMNSVRSAQIVNRTIRTVDLHDNAVKSAKVANGTLTADDLGTDSVGSDEIAENAVGSPEVAQDSLTANDLGAASVTSSEVADQSLTAARPRPELGRGKRAGHGHRPHQLDGAQSRRQRRRHRQLPGRRAGAERRRPTRPLRRRDDLVPTQRQRLALPGQEQQRQRFHNHRLRPLPQLIHHGATRWRAHNSLRVAPQAHGQRVAPQSKRTASSTAGERVLLGRCSLRADRAHCRAACAGGAGAPRTGGYSKRRPN